MYSSHATGTADTWYRPWSWRVQQSGHRHSSHLLQTLKCTAVTPQAQLTLDRGLEGYISQATGTAHTCYRPWRVQQSGHRHSSHLLQTLKCTAVRPHAQLTLVTDLEGYSSQATGRAHTCYRPWRVQQSGHRQSSHLSQTLNGTAVRPQAELILVTDIEGYSSQATGRAHTCYRPWRVQQSGHRQSSHLLQTLKGTAVRPQAELTLVTDLEGYSSQATGTAHTCYRPWRVQ